MPVGLPPPPFIVQLCTRVPVIVYLNTLSVVLSLTAQMLEPSVTRSFGLELALLRLKLLAALWLPDSRYAAFVYRYTVSLPELLVRIHTSRPLTSCVLLTAI